jgi:hypothetical protein
MNKTQRIKVQKSLQRFNNMYGCFGKDIKWGVANA